MSWSALAEMCDLAGLNSEHARVQDVDLLEPPEICATAGLARRCGLPEPRLRPRPHSGRLARRRGRAAPTRAAEGLQPEVWWLGATGTGAAAYRAPMHGAAAAAERRDDPVLSGHAHRAHAAAAAALAPRPPPRRRAGALQAQGRQVVRAGLPRPTPCRTCGAAACWPCAAWCISRSGTRGCSVA